MLIKSVSFLPASIKSMNPMQKYPHITELFACMRKMLAIMFLFPANSLISSGTCSTPKLSKQTISLLLQNNQSNVCLHMHIHKGLLHMSHPLFFRQIVSRINTIKSRFILIILLYLKIF